MKLFLLPNSKFSSSFFNGLRHPSFNVAIELVESISFEELSELNVFFTENFSDDSYEVNTLENLPINIAVLKLFLHWCYVITKKADIPVFEVGKIRQLNEKQYILFIPSINVEHAQLVFEIVKILIDIFTALSKQIFIETLKKLILKLKSVPKSGSNVPKFFQAAYEMGIPFIEITTNLQQYGYGSSLRLMSSSFTDQTSRIGARIAADKFVCSDFLAQAGIPVARHIKVTSEEEALRGSSEIGYPVVVKPADCEGGAGVFAGLFSPQEVSTAFYEAKQFSQNILIEKHIYGRDYRLNIFHDEVLWAIERVPAGVMGDGIRTIEELIDTMNSDPKRGKEGTHSVLKYLTLDNEAMDLLMKVGFTPQSILPKGQFIALRRKANINAGGTPIAVMDKIHPDNRLLAIRTAKLLHLDLAGIDFITEDISKSWKTNGGVICEVNAQPQLGGVTSSHVYGEILQKLVKRRGRIPIILIFGDHDDHLFLQIKTYFEGKNLTVGCVNSTGVSIGSMYITNVKTDLYTGGKMLMMDKEVDAALIKINDTHVLNTGLPFDRFDFLIVAGNYIEIPSSQKHISKEILIKATLKTLLLSTRYNLIEFLDNNKKLFEKSTKIHRNQLIDTINRLYSNH